MGPDILGFLDCLERQLPGLIHSARCRRKRSAY